ncbi:MAG: hypothetical protein AB3N12_01510 [Ruegeria sp.]
MRFFVVLVFAVSGFSPIWADDRPRIKLNGMLTAGELHHDCPDSNVDEYCNLWTVTTFQGVMLGAAYALQQSGQSEGSFSNAFPLAQKTIGVCPNPNEAYPVMSSKFYEFLASEANLHNEIARFVFLVFLREEYPCN